MNPPLGRRHHPCQHGGQFALAVALDAGDADDLAAIDAEREIIEPGDALMVLHREPADLEDFDPDRVRAPRVADMPDRL